jgi:hypothetical protein
MLGAAAARCALEWQTRQSPGEASEHMKQLAWQLLDVQLVASGDGVKSVAHIQLLGAVLFSTAFSQQLKHVNCVPALHVAQVTWQAVHFDASGSAKYPVSQAHQFGAFPCSVEFAIHAVQPWLVWLVQVRHVSWHPSALHSPAWG